MSSTEILPAAPLLGTDAELDALADEVANDVAAEVGASLPRDSAKVGRAVTSAMERVADHLDRTEPFADRGSLPARVYDALVGLGAAYLKRPGAAFGAAGYDEVDPLGRRAEATLLAGLTPGDKQRWGMA